MYEKDISLEKIETQSFKMAALSHRGDRSEQEDSWSWELRKEAALIVLCDGMGGLNNGSRASRLTAELLTGSFREHPGRPTLSLLLRTLHQADRQLAEEKDLQGNQIVSGTTALALLLADRTLCWLSVGDSRGYLLRQGELVQFTQDHNYLTVLKEKLKEGSISRVQYQKETLTGEALISYVGMGSLSLVDYSKQPFPLEAGDRLLLTTDGLYRLVEESRMREILREETSLEEGMRKLEEAAQEAAGRYAVKRDNMTTILVEIKAES